MQAAEGEEKWGAGADVEGPGIGQIHGPCILRNLYSILKSKHAGWPFPEQRGMEICFAFGLFMTCIKIFF